MVDNRLSALARAALIGEPSSTLEDWRALGLK
jgi:hypothetical protein